MIRIPDRLSLGLKRAAARVGIRSEIGGLLFRLWDNHTVSLDDGRFVGCDHEFARLRDVVLDADLFRRAPSENRFRSGFVQTDRSHVPEYSLPDPAGVYLSTLQANRAHVACDVAHPGLTLAVTRYEYANLYHTFTDLYNAFLICRYFGVSPKATTILLMDQSPRGHLDGFWPTLFDSVIKLETLRGRHRFDQLCFGILGYHSPITQQPAPTPPHLGEFRGHLLRSFGLTEATDPPSQIRITVVLRRDYVAHPGNPTGYIDRKFANEDELLSILQTNYPDCIVRGLALETLDLASQVRAVSQTDVLIGMHGAGLTYVLCLPGHGGLIELFPRRSSWRNQAFANLARWRNLHYQRWTSFKRQRDRSEGRTLVPHHVLFKRIDRHLRGLNRLRSNAAKPQNEPNALS